MNLLLPAEYFNINSVFYIETKPNTLIDGYFTKTNYCDPLFTMNNGIYILIKLERCGNYKCKLDLESYNNLCKLEAQLINAYTSVWSADKKKPIYKFSEVLLSKYEIVNHVGEYNTIQHLKISGIWENKLGHVGISYRG